MTLQGFEPKGDYAFQVGDAVRLQPILTEGAGKFSASPKIGETVTLSPAAIVTPTAHGATFAATYTGLDFRPQEQIDAGAAADPNETLSIFYPNDTAPASGWPVVLMHSLMSGAPLTGSAPPTSLDPADAALVTTNTKQAHQLVEEGFCVIYYGLRNLGNFDLPAPPDHHSGRWENHALMTPHKIVRNAIQWAKANAATYELDPTRVFVWGGEVFNPIVSWVAGMGNLASTDEDASTQLSTDTRVKGCIALNAIFDFEFFDDAANSSGLHTMFESATTPGVSASNYGTADQDLVRKLSPSWAFNVPESNAPWTHWFIHTLEDANAALADADFDLDEYGLPVLENFDGDAATAVGGLRDAWHAYMMWKSVLAHSQVNAVAGENELVVRAAVAASGNLPASVVGSHTRTYTDTSPLTSYITDNTFLGHVTNFAVTSANDDSVTLNEMRLHPRSGYVFGQVYTDTSGHVSVSGSYKSSLQDFFNGADIAASSNLGSFTPAGAEDDLTFDFSYVVTGATNRTNLFSGFQRNGKLKRKNPYEDGYRPKKIAAGTKLLAPFYPLAFDEARDQFAPWEPYGDNGLNVLKAFVGPHAIQQKASGEVIGVVLIRGILHADDVPLPEGATLDQLHEALRTTARDIDLHVQGIPDVR